MSDPTRDKAVRLLKKRGSLSSLSSQEFKVKSKDSMSTTSYADEPGSAGDGSHPTVFLENTYQLGPTRRFPVVAVNLILKDVLTTYLQKEKYDAELSRQMAKTLSEVVKARVKDLLIPRYKIIVLVHIGQLSGQSLLIGSRCLWDPTNDTVSSYAFQNSSLFALASVFGVYYE
ncbi:tctex1 domain-containing protein 1 [Tachyglossus aculeatus]|uniref:tctex1 domain-containing protein 1 n=1 Tax=Tachyglossus aculeatus TaxID=9261 RepID=UPI0018F73A35|nr:tctex1 domain-containing protein 1 [Tachyglossus aculeatus]